MIVEDKLKEMGLELWELGEPRGRYIYYKRVGQFLYLSGHGPFVGKDNRQVYKGKLGREIPMEQGPEIARLAALKCLCSIKAALGDLDKVKSIVRVTTYINCAGEPERYHKIADAGSDFLVELYGEAGRHARMSIGVHQNPFSAPFAMDMIVEIKE